MKYVLNADEVRIAAAQYTAWKYNLPPGSYNTTFHTEKDKDGNIIFSIIVEDVK